MIRILRAALIGLFCASSMAMAVPAHAATASGRLIMGTEGASLPEDLRVTVLRTDPQGEPAGQPEFVPVGEEGEFRFDADPGTGHLVGLFYLDVTYSRLVEAGQTDGIELTLYETTEDPDPVQVVSDSITVLQSNEEGQGDTLEVLQLLRYVNSSDRTYVGSETIELPDGELKAVLKLPLPESVFDLAPADPANSAGLATAQGRLVSTAPLKPGEASVAYLYRVAVPRTGWQLRREVYYPTSKVDLLIGGGLRVTAAPGFGLEETATLGGVEYDRHRHGEINPGAVIEVDIGFPATSTTGLWLGFGGLAAALAALFGGATIVMRRKRRRVTAGEAAAQGGEQSEAEAQGGEQAEAEAQGGEQAEAEAQGGEPAEAEAQGGEPAEAEAQGGEPAEAEAQGAEQAEVETPEKGSRRQLIEHVALLDERYETSGIDEEDYRRQREDLLAQIEGLAETESSGNQ